MKKKSQYQVFLYAFPPLPPPQNPLHPTRWPAFSMPVRQDGPTVASGEDGTPAPFQQTDLQTGLSGHGEKGRANAHKAIQAGDEGDCGTCFGCFDRLSNHPIGEQTKQENLVLLSARAGECSKGGEGVLPFAYTVSGRCGSWFDRLTNRPQRGV